MLYAKLFGFNALCRAECSLVASARLVGNVSSYLYLVGGLGLQSRDLEACIGSGGCTREGVFAVFEDIYFVAVALCALPYGSDRGLARGNALYADLSGLCSRVDLYSAAPVGLAVALGESFYLVSVLFARFQLAVNVV